MRVGEARRLHWTGVDFQKLQKIFGESPNALKASFFQKRKALAMKLQNPRLMRIGFHILRHWKATIEYHKTKDILHVKKLLGRKRVENTKIYIDIEQALYPNAKRRIPCKSSLKTRRN